MRIRSYQRPTLQTRPIRHGHRLMFCMSNYENVFKGLTPNQGGNIYVAREEWGVHYIIGGREGGREGGRGGDDGGAGPVWPAGTVTCIAVTPQLTVSSPQHWSFSAQLFLVTRPDNTDTWLLPSTPSCVISAEKYFRNKFYLIMPLKVTLVSPRSRLSLKTKSTVSVTSEFEYLNLPSVRSPRGTKEAEKSSAR